MKILKYSLFLGVASALICNSSLVAENVNFSPVQLGTSEVIDGQPLEVVNSDLLTKEAMLQQDNDLNQEALPNPNMLSSSSTLDLGLTQELEEQRPIIVEPTIIDDTTPPATLDAKNRIEEALEKKLAEIKEREAAEKALLTQQEQETMLASQMQDDSSLVMPVDLDAQPAKKVRKGKLTPEQIEELKAAGAAKREARASKVNELMPFNEEELTGAENEFANNANVEQEVLLPQDNMLVENTAVSEEQLIASVKQKKPSKRTKLTPEQIEELKAAGEEKREARAKAKRAAEEQAVLLDLEHQQELAMTDAEELGQHNSTTAAIQMDENRKPYAILYFTPEGAVDLRETINKGAAFNKKEGIDPEIIVIDPTERKEVVNDSGPIIVRGTEDGPEVDLNEQHSPAVDDVKVSADIVEKKEKEETDNPLSDLLQ